MVARGDDEGGFEQFAYDGQHMIGAYEQGIAKWEATYTSGQDQMIGFYDYVGGADLVPIRDWRNNVVSAFDMTTQIAFGHAEYSPEGRITSNVNGAQPCVEEGTGAICALPGGMPFAFNGQWRSDKTGLTYMRNRWYSARLGQFVTTDPLHYVDSVNQYAFVGFDPINAWDPYGLGADDLSDDDDGGCASGAGCYSNGDLFFFSAVNRGNDFADNTMDPAIQTTKKHATTAANKVASVRQDYCSVIDLQCNALLGGMEYGLRDVPGDRQGWYLQGAFALAGGLEAASIRLASLGRGAGTRALNLVDDVADAAKALEKLCPGGRCQAMCFTAGTPVVTSEGLLVIELVEVGDRVPQYGGEQCSIEPFVDDLASCTVITLEFENPFSYEDSLVVELIRSTAWLEAHQVEVGGMVRLTFEELKVDDNGYVRSISSCPVIAQGEGCVVTGTFTHLNSDVLELTFANSDLVLQPTALHPLWSEDRNDWVRAGLLMVGEHLRSESGPLEIATMQWVDGAHQVFNLEVAGNHTYLVGADKVLSHNSCSLEEAAQAAKMRFNMLMISLYLKNTCQTRADDGRNLQTGRMPML